MDKPRLQPQCPFGLNLKQWVGDDLHALIRRRKGHLKDIVDIAPVTTKHGRRGTFRLTFDNGEVLKGRAFPAAKTAIRVASILTEVNLYQLSPFVDHQGAAMLERWIDGHVLSKDLVTSEVLRKCGRLLGRLHRIEPSPQWPAKPDLVGRCLTWIQTRLRQLVKHGRLSRAEYRRLWKLAQNHAPGDVSVGFVHRDLCPENIVMRGEVPICIDQGLLDYDAYAEDLVRVWYRWPMATRDFENFLDGYQEFASTKEFFESFCFWSIAVLARAAVYQVAWAENQHASTLPLLREILNGQTRHFPHPPNDQ